MPDANTPPEGLPGPIGLIGVGLMGTALAECWRRSGVRVVGWDLDPARNGALVDLGGEAAGGPDVVLAACPRVVLSLPTPEVSGRVLRSVDPRLLDGRLVVDTSTGEPETAEALAAWLVGLNATYLDATISGSSAQVRAGEVTVMIGGPVEAVGRCLDLFDGVARSVRHVGPAGSGSRMKLVTNLVLGLNRAALAEGLALARALGVEPARALEVLRDGMAYSRIMDTKGEKMVRGDFASQARLAQHRKDVGLMLDAAARAGLGLPLTEAHRALLDRAIAAGMGDLDNSAVARVYELGPPREGRDGD